MNSQRNIGVASAAGSYLVVELTNRCNLRCVHCAVADPDHPHHAQQAGSLNPALFESVLHDLEAVDGHFDNLIMFWLGEPLLHPNFGRIYRSALRSAVRFQTFLKLEVHTNAVPLTLQRRRDLLNSAVVPQVLHFSLDASCRETYLRVKGRDQFDDAIQNAEQFIIEQTQLGARWPRPVFQFIVGSNNVADIPDFVAHWTAVCSRAGRDARLAAGHVPPGEDPVLFFRQLDCPTAAEQERENALFRKAMTELGLELPPQAAQGEQVLAENTTACSGFWKSPVLDWTGKLTACTRDNHLLNSLGNVADSPFSELWWGEQMLQRRNQVSKGCYDGLELCTTCFIPRSLNHSELSESEIADYREQQVAGGLRVWS